MTDSIIIKTNILMHPDDEDVLRKRMLSQMQEGVVILPPYCKIVYPEYKVIERIRAEIQAIMDMYEGCEYIGDKARRDELWHVLEIIDKCTE